MKPDGNTDSAVNLQQVLASVFNIKFNIHFDLVWNEMQSSLPTDTDQIPVEIP